MLCGSGLDQKLNLYDVTKFMNEYATNPFLGRPRSGKTPFLYSIFKQKYAVRVDLVTSWSPGRKKRRATSWLLRGRQVGLTQVDKVR